MKTDDLVTVSHFDLTESEKRLMNQIAKYRSILPYSIVIILFVIVVWYRFFDLFSQRPFFMIYNAIIYLALVAGLCSSYFYTRKIALLLKKLITVINSKHIEP